VHLRVKKLKVPRNGPKGPGGGGDWGAVLLFLYVGPRRGWVVSPTPRPFYPRERPGTHCRGGWVHSSAGLDVCEEPRPPPGFDHWTVQHLASRYTDWDIPAPAERYSIKTRVPVRVPYRPIVTDLIKQLCYKEIRRLRNPSLFLKTVVSLTLTQQPTARPRSSLISTLLISETRVSSYFKDSRSYNNNTFALFPFYF
jgi:hypothetical protein